jgi:hypothetical protein
MNVLLNNNKYVVDVSHWWLPYVENILDMYKNAKFVVIKRNKVDTVRSIMSIKGSEKKGAINHWNDHHGTYWKKNSWDKCYPKFNELTLEESISAYYD